MNTRLIVALLMGGLAGTVSAQSANQIQQEQHKVETDKQLMQQQNKELGTERWDLNHKIDELNADKLKQKEFMQKGDTKSANAMEKKIQQLQYDIDKDRQKIGKNKQEITTEQQDMGTERWKIEQQRKQERK